MVYSVSVTFWWYIQPLLPYDSIFHNQYILMVYSETFDGILYYHYLLMEFYIDLRSILEATNEMVQPPCSSDMSPIRHLWDVMERVIQMQDHPPKNIRKLLTAVKRTWLNISPQTGLLITCGINATLRCCSLPA